MKKNPFIPLLITAFLMNTLGPMPLAQAQELVLPKPGEMVYLSPPMNPPILKGIKVHSDNPFRFDFILDVGDGPRAIPEKGDHRGSPLQDESVKLIKYFLASLTIPEKDLWVNLSPYEKDRIVPESFGVTEMGRDLLAQDYMLKQITASLIYPEDEIGKKFWKRIYEEAAKKYNTTNIPVNTFNKVWIVPEKAVVYENLPAGRQVPKAVTAYVVESRLKVMLEQDYLALDKNAPTRGHHEMVSPSRLPSDQALNVKASQGTTETQNDINQIGSQIVREIVIPELTKEVNEGANFAQLRQVYNSLILATWYKKKIKDSILSQVYADKNKTQGVNIQDPEEKQKIYQQYLQAFKKGVYNYIKEERNPLTQEMIPKKYFSGGMLLKPNEAMLVTKVMPVGFKDPGNLAMISGDFRPAEGERRDFELTLGGSYPQRMSPEEVKRMSFVYIDTGKFTYRFFIGTDFVRYQRSGEDARSIVQRKSFKLNEGISPRKEEFLFRAIKENGIYKFSVEVANGQRIKVSWETPRKVDQPVLPNLETVSAREVATDLLTPPVEPKTPSPNPTSTDGTIYSDSGSKWSPWVWMSTLLAVTIGVGLYLGVPSDKPSQDAPVQATPQEEKQSPPSQPVANKPTVKPNLDSQDEEDEYVYVRPPPATYSTSRLDTRKPDEWSEAKPVENTVVFGSGVSQPEELNRDLDHITGPILLEVLSGSLPRGTLIVRRNQISMEANGVLTGHARLRKPAVEELDSSKTVLLRMKLPFDMKMGSLPVEAYTVPGYVITKVTGEGIELAPEGNGFIAVNDDHSAFVTYEIMPLKKGYEFEDENVALTEQEQKEIDVLKTNPAFVTLMENLGSLTPEELVKKFEEFAQKNTPYSIHYKFRIRKILTGMIAARLNAGQKAPLKCDEIAALAFLVFKAHGMYPIYQVGWVMDGGNKLRRQVGHAWIAYKGSDGLSHTADFTNVMGQDAESYKGKYEYVQIQARVLSNPDSNPTIKKNAFDKLVAIGEYELLWELVGKNLQGIEGIADQDIPLKILELELKGQEKSKGYEHWLSRGAKTWLKKMSVSKDQKTFERVVSAVYPFRDSFGYWTEAISYFMKEGINDGRADNVLEQSFEIMLNRGSPYTFLIGSNVVREKFRQVHKNLKIGPKAHLYLFESILANRDRPLLEGGVYQTMIANFGDNQNIGHLLPVFQRTIARANGKDATFYEQVATALVPTMVKVAQGITAVDKDEGKWRAVEFLVWAATFSNEPKYPNKVVVEKLKEYFQGKFALEGPIVDILINPKDLLSLKKDFVFSKKPPANDFIERIGRMEREYKKYEQKPSKKPTKKKQVKQRREDKAKNVKGGIDLNAEQMDLEIQNEDDEIRFNIDPAMIEEFQKAPGFTPVINNIQPLESLSVFLGINK